MQMRPTTGQRFPAMRAIARPEEGRRDTVGVADGNDGDDAIRRRCPQQSIPHAFARRHTTDACHTGAQGENGLEPKLRR